jgi:membrane protease YdiL (CAAX protease family)
MVAVEMGRVAGDEPTGTGPTQAKLVAWVVLVGLLALLSYSARVGTDDAATDSREALYEYTTAIGGAVQYGFMLLLIVLIARGGPARELLALRAPRSWGRAVLLMLGGLATIWVVGAVLNIFLKAGEEQGLVPEGWEADRAGAFAANFLVVALAAPVVEELLYRGLGLSLVGAVTSVVVAVTVTSLAFGLAHGLVVALPVLTIFGVVLGVLRVRTDSVYPPIVLHAFFNGAALIAAVTLDVGT